MGGVVIKEIVESSDKDLKFILKGPTGSGKSTLLLNRYKYMVENLKVPSDKILILVLNKIQSLSLREKVTFTSSGAIWITSYYEFIKQEITTYYPIVLNSCNEIKSIRLKPLFLSFESLGYLLSKVIGYRRKNDNFFPMMTASTDKIARDLTANILKAATSGIPFEEIGNRLYNSLEIKNEIKKDIFHHADAISEACRKRCLELGIFDYGMAVDLYNNTLLKDPSYLKQLSQRVRHLIVDNIEECVPTEVDFIELLLPNVGTCLLGYNHEGGYGELFGSNISYVNQKLLTKMNVIDMEKSFTCSSAMYEFSEMLFDNLKNQATNRVNAAFQIEKTPPLALRSEMLEKIGERIIKLVFNEGYSPSDIVVLSTYADPVTEYVIGSILEKKGVRLKALVKNNRFVDNQISQALVTFAKICHPSYRVYPNRDQVRELIRLILKMDPVRSSILAGKMMRQKPFTDFPEIENSNLEETIGEHNIQKYEYVKNWVGNYKSNACPLPMCDFFQKVMLEILILTTAKQEDISQAKKLIDASKTFAQVVSKFNLNADKDFLKMIEKGLKPTESIFELEEKFSGDFVLLSTPTTYLSASLSSKVTILSSVSSENWYPRNAKDFTNIHVLTKTWNPSDTYTQGMEEKKRRSYLATLSRAIIKRCKEKLITFESNISSNGFENTGILSEYLDELLTGSC